MTERRKMKKPENVWFLLGALAVLAMGIPYLIPVSYTHLTLPTNSLV